MLINKNINDRHNVKVIGQKLQVGNKTGSDSVGQHLYLAVSAPGAADTGRSPTGPSAAPSGGDSGEGPHLRAAYSCSAAAGPPPPNSSESRRAVAAPATGHTSALQVHRCVCVSESALCSRAWARSTSILVQHLPPTSPTICTTYFVPPERFKLNYTTPTLTVRLSPSFRMLINNINGSPKYMLSTVFS